MEPNDDARASEGRPARAGSSQGEQGAVCDRGGNGDMAQEDSGPSPIGTHSEGQAVQTAGPTPHGGSRRWSAGRRAGRGLGYSVGSAKTLCDLLIIVAAAVWTWLACLGQLPSAGSPWPLVAADVAARLPLYLLLGVWRLSWRYVSRRDLLWVVAYGLAGTPLIGLAFVLFPRSLGLPSVTRLDLLLFVELGSYVTLAIGARLAVRIWSRTQPPRKEAQSVLILGAGSAGEMLAHHIQELSRDYHILGFLDDDPTKRRLRVRGLPMLGGLSDVVSVAKAHSTDILVLAIPSLTPQRLRDVLKLCEATGLPVRTVPSLSELLRGKSSVGALREVRMEDLLPRPPVQLDRTFASRYLAGKTVLVTGGGGSIGRELCRQVIEAGASHVLVLGRGENSVFEAILELAEMDGPCRVTPVICDIRDRDGLRQVFDRFAPNILFHAAAHKHVPLMELYPAEAVKNNVFGTLNVVELAIEHQVERLVLISTDKAVRPANVMGASKRVAELIVQSQAGVSDTKMVCVRFGNVLGSRGSVVPIMMRQIRKRHPVTVTDPEMTRYFMTIPEAVQLVIQAGGLGGDGEVFILDMGEPVRIIDLACDLIRLAGLTPHQDIPIRIMGRRPGEKVTEELVTAAEAERWQRNGPFWVVPNGSVSPQRLLPCLEKLRSLDLDGNDGKILSILCELVSDLRPQPADEGAPSDGPQA